MTAAVPVDTLRFQQRALTERVCCAAWGWGTLTGPLIFAATSLLLAPRSWVEDPGENLVLMGVATLVSVTSSFIGMLFVGTAVSRARSVEAAGRRSLVGTLLGGTAVAVLPRSARRAARKAFTPLAAQAS